MKSTRWIRAVAVLAVTAGSAIFLTIAARARAIVPIDGAEVFMAVVGVFWIMVAVTKALVPK